MNLPVFALFSRSLLLEVRSLRGHLVRLAWLGGTLLMIYAATENGRWGWQAAPGLDVFRHIMVLDMILICLVGVQLFPNAITEEKEEQTLDLLRMTSLSPVAILLGKSAGRMIAMGILLLVQLPFTLLSITLGGIALPQILAAYAALLGLVLVMANLGLLWSVLCRRGGFAMMMMTLTMLALFLAPPIIYQVGMSMQFSKSPELGQLIVRLVEPLMQISPFVRCNNVLAGFDGDIIQLQLLANIAMALLCFFLSWGLFEPFARRRPSDGAGRGGILKAKPEAKAPSMWRVSRVWDWPLAWKTFFFESYGGLGWLIRVLMIVLTTTWIVVSTPRSQEVEQAMMVFFLILLACVVEGGLIASSIFRSERTARTWASVFVTPKGLGAICWQKVAGALFGMLPWFVAMAVTFVIGLAADADQVWDAVDDIFFDEPIAVYCLPMFGAFMVLSALISLWVKRGGSVLAFGAIVVGNIMMSVVIQDGDGVFALGLFSYIIICITGPAIIAQRLQQIAASD